MDVPKELEAPSVMAFTGWKGYPKITVSPVLALTPQTPHSERILLDVQKALEEMVRTARPFVLRDVHAARDPDYTLMTIQELAMAKRPTMVDTEFEKIRKIIAFNPVTEPLGPAGPARRIAEEENVKVVKDIERMYYDDVRAEDAVWELYRRGIDVYSIVSPFSMGIFGERKERRLVPTRWAITAVDDIVSRRLKENVKRYPLLSEILLFESHFMDNHFYVILLPIPWSFELIEAWMPSSIWVAGMSPVLISDFEGSKGRTSYAENVGGSYYATRLAVLEFLDKTKKQAAALVLREVREGYFAPLGVWQVRENVRRAFNERPKRFATPEEVIKYIKEHTRVGELWFKKSWLWDRFLHQKRIV